MPKLELLRQVTERTGTQNTGTVTIKAIPIGQISVRQNIREHDNVDIDGLKESIKTTGLLQPITVCKDEDDYICIIGQRRLQAYRELYNENKDLYHSIDAIITDNKNITVRQLIENVQRADLKPIELYHALKELRQEGLTIKEIAGVIGKAEGYIKNLFSGIKELESDPENMDLLKSDTVSLSDFKAVKPVKDKTVKKELLKQRAKKIITRKELQNRAKKKTIRKIVYQISETEAVIIRGSINRVLKRLQPREKGGFKGHIILSDDDYKALSGLSKRLSGAI